MKTIVFLCVENSCRSQMAEAFGKMIGADRYQFFSAGSKPSGKVNPKAMKVMSDIGYDMSDHQSKGIDSLPQEGVTAMVSMGCGDACPQIPALIRLEWEIPDPKYMDDKGFKKVRDEIGLHVEKLIKQMDNDDSKN